MTTASKFELPADAAPRQTDPFTLANGKQYVLREATEDAATEYQNGLLRATRLADGKVCGIDGMADVEPKLVAKCLFEVDATGPGTYGPVTVGFVRGLTSRVVKPMFEWVKENSDLDRPSEEDPLRAAVMAALTLEDAPVTLEAFTEFSKKAAATDPDKYGPLWDLMKPTVEEEAKKSPAPGTATSASPTS